MHTIRDLGSDLNGCCRARDAALGRAIMSTRRDAMHTDRIAHARSKAKHRVQLATPTRYRVPDGWYPPQGMSGVRGGGRRTRICKKIRIFLRNPLLGERCNMGRKKVFVLFGLRRPPLQNFPNKGGANTIQATRPEP